MTWLVWRQHRKQLLFAVAALAVLAALFIGTGRPMHDRYERAGLPDCLPQAKQAPVVVDLAAAPGEGAPAGVDNAPAQDTPELDDATLADARCTQDARAFYEDYQNVIFVGLLLLVLPMLAGMFWGAPLVAREIENGTHRLVWTQGVSRLRWAATKIGLVSIAVLVITAIYAGMLTWWITPVIETSGQGFSYIFFDIHGLVVFGYVLFALALGVFAGAVTGRLLPAMATTGYPQMRNDLNGDWIVASHEGANTEVLTVHPADQFWAFQAIETAIFVALAIALLMGSIYWIRRRVA
jgi:hypothetical protein